MNTLYDKISKRLIYAKGVMNRLAYRFMPVPQPGKWVFIVGCYNSGTTLLHGMMALHPDIGSMPLEGRQFTNELPLAEDHGLKRLWALDAALFYLDENKGHDIDVDKVKRQWAFMYNDARRPLLLEKSIINAGRTRWLQKHFENSHFIVLIRNGYAVAEGIRRKEGHPVEKGILQWKNTYEILMADMPALGKKLFLTYEELTASPVETLMRISEFLGIDAFASDVTGRKFKVHSHESAIVDMNKKSVESLSGEDIRRINAIAGDLLKQTGYYTGEPPG